MLPVMIVRFYQGWFEMVMIDLPLIAASFWSISALCHIAHRELHPKNMRAGVFVPACSFQTAAGRCPYHYQFEGCF